MHMKRSVTFRTIYDIQGVVWSVLLAMYNTLERLSVLLYPLTNEYCTTYYYNISHRASTQIYSKYFHSLWKSKYENHFLDK